MAADLFLTNIAILFSSLVLLMIASQWVIENAIKISHLAKLSEMFVGFIFIAIATSLPELAVSVSALASGDIGIGIGNLIGSNIADIALIVGIASFFGPVILQRKLLREITTILFLTSLIPLVLLNIRESGKLVGLVLVLVFFAFIIYSGRKNLKPRMGKIRNHMNNKTEDHPFKAKLLVTAMMFFAVGIAGVFVSSRFVVDAAAA